MSKNRNYTDYSKAFGGSSIEENKEVIVEPVNPVVEETEVVEETPVENNKIVVKEVVKEKKYKLVNCDALNIRESPNGSHILDIAKKTETLVEVGSSSDPDWVNVKTSSGVVGFAKKEFLSEI